MKRVSALLALGVAIGGVVGWRVLDDARAADPSPQAVPVTTAVAKRQDVPVLLDGLGTVQAFNEVDIKAQVNGTLIALPVGEGQEVHKGDVVAEIDPRPYQAALDQAKAQLQADQATQHGAQLDLERYQKLARSQFAPVQQVDDQLATVAKGAGSIAGDQAANETAQINLDYCVIRAPIEGRIGLYNLDVGNLLEVSSATTIISITQDRPIAVVFTLPEQDLLPVRAAQARGPVPVLVTSNDAAHILARGTLLTPNNTIDTTSGTISIKAQFGNEDDHLWPGEFVNTRIQVETLHQAVTIPTVAVEHGPDGLFVYTVKPDQTVAQTTITTGYADGGLTVVTKGLTGDETVVVAGQSRLSPGTPVKPTDVANAPGLPQSGAADGSQG